ncbi:hypothetical protein [Streptomyces sp. NPDC055287]
MKHESTINELATMHGLFSTVDHITVPETDPNTGTIEHVTLPPPLIRRKQLRDDTTLWILTAPGINERIHVADHAPVTVYLKTPDPTRPTRPTGHHPPQAAPQHGPVDAVYHPGTAPHQAPTDTAWQQQQQQPAPTHQHAPQQPAAPQRRPTPPWNQHPQN